MIYLFIMLTIDIIQSKKITDIINVDLKRLYKGKLIKEKWSETLVSTPLHPNPNNNVNNKDSTQQQQIFNKDLGYPYTSSNNRILAECHRAMNLSRRKFNKKKTKLNKNHIGGFQKSKNKKTLTSHHFYLTSHCYTGVTVFSQKFCQQLANHDAIFLLEAGWTRIMGVLMIISILLVQLILLVVILYLPSLFSKFP